MLALFTVLFVFSITGFILAIFTPKTALWWESNPTRGRALMFYSVCAVIFLVLFSVIAPPESQKSLTENKESATKVKPKENFNKEPPEQVDEKSGTEKEIDTSSVVTYQSNAETYRVCSSGCQFRFIQQAIDAAEDGDKIEIGKGTYKTVLSIDKNLTLKGTPSKEVQIQGLKEDVPILLVGPSDINVQIENISFVEAKGGCTYNKRRICAAGISITGKATIYIKNSTFTNNTRGIRLMGSSRANIDNCTFTNNNVGIRLMGSSRANIDNCTFSRNVAYGIILLDSSHATIAKCNILGVEDTFWSGGYGIMANDSSQLSVSNCNISSHFNGLDVENSATANVNECTLSDSENGITLRHTAKLDINNSKIINNGTGIMLSTLEYELFEGKLTGHNNEIYGNGDNAEGLEDYSFLL